MERIGLLAVLACVVFVQAAVGAEAPVGMNQALVRSAVAKAPPVPVDLGLDLQLRLVDFIDCTNPRDPHDFGDYGVSKIVDGPAGRYRVTASHRHAFFAYRWKREKQDQPHVLVFEYPDDAKREICFLTHESGLSGRKNIDWSLETGVYCGNPFPLTGKMQYHTAFFWPADEYPVAMVGNWARTGAPAACSRIWVFAVDGGLPGMKVDDPDPANPRIMGEIYNWSLVPRRGIFGLTDSMTAFEHVAQYHAYLGHNVVSWPVVSGNSWGFQCIIPAWDGGEETENLEPILSACDRNGIKFIAIFNNGYGFRIGGKGYSEESKAEYAAGLRKGFEQFVERYGHHPSLYAIGMDTQDLSPRYGQGALDCIRDCFDGDLGKFVEFIHGLKPDLKVCHLLGGRSIHAQYFPNADEIIERWEGGTTAWSQHLANEVRALWEGWGRDPAELNEVEGLTTVLNYQSDDHAIFDAYSQNPRAMFYYDLDTSQARADLIDSRAVLIWNTFFEAWLGLYPDPQSFWYLKEWVAPDFCAAPPSALAGWAHAMMHRDRDMILAGAWNRKGGGHEAAIRRFARELRSLPPIELKDVVVQGNSPVQVRAGTWKGNTYASVLNATPFDAEVSVTMGGKQQVVSLAPFALKALQAAGEVPVSAKGEAAEHFVTWLQERLDEYAKLLGDVRALDPAAAPQPYAEHLARAQGLISAGKLREADVELGHGLTTELALRKRVLDPPQTRVPRVSSAPPMNGDLDAWPDEAVDITAEDANIATHLFFPASWHGPDDLSARVRLAHDGAKLYVGIEVRDNVLSEKDSVALYASQQNYRKWLPQDLPYELRFDIALPLKEATVKSSGAHGFTCTTRRTRTGYVAEGSIDMKDLNLSAGSTLGWVFQISEDDNTPHLTASAWARKAAMLIPNNPTFAYWSDARTCEELLLE